MCIRDSFNTRGEQKRSGSTEGRGEEGGWDARGDGGLRFVRFYEAGAQRREDGPEGNGGG